MIGIQWPLVVFSLLAGTGGCTFAFGALAGLVGKGDSRARIAIGVVTLVMLAVGGFFAVSHVTLPQNVMAAATRVSSLSGISVEFVLAGVTFVAVFANVVALVRGASDAVVKASAAIGLAAGLALAFFDGQSYVVPGRPLWNTELLPLAFFGTALAGGAFLNTLVELCCKVEPEGKWQGLLRLAAAVLGLVTLIAYVALLASKGALEGETCGYAVVAIAASALGAAAGMGLFLSRKAPLAFTALGAVLTVAAGLLLRVMIWTASTGFLNLLDLAATLRG